MFSIVLLATKIFSVPALCVVWFPPVPVCVLRSTTTHRLLHSEEHKETLVSKFRPFSKPRKVRQAQKQARQDQRNREAVPQMHKLTSGCWKKAKEVKRLRLPSGS